MPSSKKRSAPIEISDSDGEEICIVVRPSKATRRSATTSSAVTRNSQKRAAPVTRSSVTVDLTHDDSMEALDVGTSKKRAGKQIPALPPSPVTIETLTPCPDYEDDLSCAICMELFLDPVNLNGCGHVFCRACVDEWLEEHDNGCPTCKAKHWGQLTRALLIESITNKYFEGVISALKASGKKKEASEKKRDRAEQVKNIEKIRMAAAHKKAERENAARRRQAAADQEAAAQRDAIAAQRYNHLQALRLQQRLQMQGRERNPTGQVIQGFLPRFMDGGGLL